MPKSGRHALIRGTPSRMLIYFMSLFHISRIVKIEIGANSKGFSLEWRGFVSET